MIKRIIFFIVSLLIFFGCEQDTYLFVDKESISFSEYGGTQTINVIANGNWSVTKNDNSSWYSFSRSKNDVGGVLSVTCVQNKTTEARSSSLIVRCGNQMELIKMSQSEKTVSAEMVDLGLSVKWRNRNLGASTPEGYGNHYAWGETSTKINYNWSTYKYCNGDYNTLTKYCNKSSYGYNGYTDSKTVLDLEDDAAGANWDGSWRMPTDAEWTELRNNCTWTWTTQNGVNGYRVKSKTNGNSIFLPAAGYRGSTGLNYFGSQGFYWSSTLNTDFPDLAWYVYFNSSNIGRYKYNRYYGQSIRPVLAN